MSNDFNRNRPLSPRHRVNAGTDALVEHNPPIQYVAVEPPPAATGPGLGDALRLLWRRRWLLVLATTAGGAVAYAVTSSMPSLYAGEARVLIGLQGPRVMNAESVITDVSPDAERVQNESIILQSRTIAKQVVEELHLAGNPAFNPELAKPTFWSNFSLQRLDELMPTWLREMILAYAPTSPAVVPPTEAQRTQALVDLLLTKIDVAALGRSHVLSIKAEARDPALAAAIANSFAEKYLEFQRQEKLRTMDRVDGFLMKRVRDLREQVRRSDQAVEDYRRANGLYKSGGNSVTTQQLSELNTQLMVAQTAKAEADARLAEAQSLRQGHQSAETVPEVLRSPLVAALKQQQADAERRAAMASALHGAQHPEYRRVQAEAGAIGAMVTAEVAKVVDGLARDARTADARYNSLLQQFDQLKAKMGSVNSASIQLEALERDAAVNRNLLEAVLSRAKQTTASADILEANAKLISAAVPATAPSFPPKALFVALGSLASLLSGAAAALMLETGNRTFRRPEEVEATTGVPVLSMVPEVRRRTVTQKVVHEPTSPYSEALRRLFIGIELADPAIAPKRILFSSAVPAEGKSVMATSLARLLATSGKKVLIIDCDWRSARIQTLMRCANGPGLGELLSNEEVVLNDCIHRDSLSQCDIITAGSWSLDNSHLLHSDRMAQLLDLLSASYDAIVLDCPPVLVTADALALSRIADKVVYVVRWGHTRTETATEGLKQFIDAQAPVAGIAVSRVVVKEYRRYGHHDLSYTRAPVATFG
jgi:succinoglycan biosynthesis transport protein ExoP